MITPPNYLLCNRELTKCIFFIPDAEGEIGGRPIVNNRNLLALSEVFSTVDIVTFHRPSNKWWRKWLDLKLIFSPSSSEAYHELLKKVEDNPDCHVFFTHSKFGVFVRNLKKRYPNIHISVFFHNVELIMAWKRFKATKNIVELLVILKYWISERCDSKFSNELFVLNSRDANLLNKYYRDSIGKDFTLPMTLIDRIGRKERSYGQRPWRLLFVGTYFWANIPGLIKIITEVMPRLQNVAELYVVGKGMEKLKEKAGEADNIFYIGGVSQQLLDKYYRDMDIFIAPITTGGGMKTKIAEAMMFGMPIIGTTEAFMGYDIDISNIGYCSDDMDSYVDFIKKLTNEDLKSFSWYSRKYFEEHYSLDCTIRRLKRHYSNNEIQ